MLCAISQFFLCKQTKRQEAFQHKIKNKIGKSLETVLHLSNESNAHIYNLQSDGSNILETMIQNNLNTIDIAFVAIPDDFDILNPIFEILIKNSSVFIEFVFDFILFYFISFIFIFFFLIGLL